MNIGDQRESERKTVEEEKSTDRKMLGPQGDFGCVSCVRTEVNEGEGVGHFLA